MPGGGSILELEQVKFKFLHSLTGQHGSCLDLSGGLAGLATRDLQNAGLATRDLQNAT